MTIKIPETKLININSIKTDGKNPNSMSKEKLDALCKNIETYGFINPIITNKDLIIADGEHRWKAGKKLKLREVPVIVLDIKEVDRRILRQVLNKLHGIHNEDMDLDEYRLIMQDDGGELFKELMGNDDELLSQLAKLNDSQEKIVPLTNEDEVPEQAPSIVSLGDVWLLGEHRLLCGDATNKTDVNTLMNGEKADMVFTDPPYNTGMSKKNNSGSTRLSHMFDDDYSPEEWKQFLSKIMNNYYNLMKDDSAMYMCFYWKRNHELIKEILHNKFNLKNIIIWDKMVHGLGPEYKYTYEVINFCTKGTPSIDTHQGEREYSDVWHIQRAMGKNEQHATAKPIELCERAIRHCTKANMIVDLFGGSGSTLIACEKIKRKCYMMELDPKYCDVIIKRWEDYTGQKAVKQ